MQEVSSNRRLHLLRPDSFKNKAPQKLIQQSLNLEAQAKRISYIGMKPQKSKTIAQIEKEDGMQNMKQATPTKEKIDQQKDYEKASMETDSLTINIV